MLIRKVELSMNREETLERLSSEISCVQKLLDTKYSEVIEISYQQKLREILKKMTFFQEKLKNNTFEISIVGLEKSGKSTFANAFMGNDVLPTKDARCTYTATSIRFGTENDAQVDFYSDAQFNEEFHRKLNLLGIENPQHWSEWSKELLDKETEQLPPLRSEQKNIYNDILEIITNRSSIQNLIGSESLHFVNHELETEVKEYIENPAKALAVKEIVIRSDKLSAMRNAIIYDVPGFDSPTQLHKDQTRAWMKKSDAVILIVNADRPSFNDSLVQFFESVDKDDDGISIGEKLFVFANRADIATTLQDNLQRIREELQNYRIMPTALIAQRLTAGSARARIELDNGNTQSAILQSLKEKGLAGDGIDTIRSLLEDYNNTVRLQVMQQRIANLKENVLALFSELRQENQIDGNSSIELQMDNLVDELKRTARQRIHNALAECRTQIVQQCKENKPITDKVRKNAIQSIDPVRYQITEDEIRRAQYEELSGAGVLERFDASIRDSKFTAMYEEFIDNVVHLAVEEYRESEKQILTAFESGLEVTPSHPFFKELEKALKKYISEQCGKIAPEGYYNSLIRRYSRSLFEILISTPFGNIARYKKFDDDRRNFYSISLFTDEENPQIQPDKQSMHYQILFHQQINSNNDPQSNSLNDAIVKVESVTNEVIAVNSPLYHNLQNFCEKHPNNALAELDTLLAQLPPVETADANAIPFFAIQENPAVTKLNQLLEHALQESPNSAESQLTERAYAQFFQNYRKTIEKIPSEFNQDVCILKNILNEQVMNAVSIEIPFLDLVKQDIISLQKSLETAAFTSFINMEKAHILEEKYNQLNAENENRKRRLEIIREIDRILAAED